MTEAQRVALAAIYSDGPFTEFDVYIRVGPRWQKPVAKLEALGFVKNTGRRVSITAAGRAEVKRQLATGELVED